MPEFITPAWRAPPRVHALTTTRGGGSSSGPYASLNLASHVGDAPAHVQSNRERLRTGLQLPAAPCWLDQTHGNDLIEIAGERASPPAADAAYTRRAGLVCAVLTADCLPILLCDRAATTVVAIHAGWRGLLAGILARSVQRVVTDPGQWIAWIGPAISGLAYEVGAELVARFVAADPQWAVHFPRTESGFHADLPALAAAQLDALGISEVTRYEGCTAGEPGRFFSYRRDGVTGRIATLIWLS